MNYMMIFFGATRINMPHLHQQIPKGMASPTDRISSYFQEAPGMGASDSRKIRRNCCGLDSQRILLVSIEILLSGDVFLTVCELENGH